jgi:hypothetical protein
VNLKHPNGNDPTAFPKRFPARSNLEAYQQCIQSWWEHATQIHTVSISAQESHVISQQGGMCMGTYMLNYRTEIRQAVAISILLCRFT